MGQIHALLAERGYEISGTAPNTIRLREVDSGIAIQAVLEGSILYFSLVCTVVPKSATELVFVAVVEEILFRGVLVRVGERAVGTRTWAEFLAERLRPRRLSPVE